MNDDGHNLVENLHRQVVAQAGQPAFPPAEPPTVHYTELPEAQPDSPLYWEWHTYRREAGRLLAEGHAGRHVLIKGRQIIVVCATHEEALATGYQCFLDQPFLVHQVQEPLRVRALVLPL